MSAHKTREDSRRTYGARTFPAELGDTRGQNVNLKLVQTIISEQRISGLPAQRGFKWSDSSRYTGDDLVTWSFRRNGPNELWMTDITEHPTTKGKVYCCALLDEGSRRTVGWLIHKVATTAMVNSTLAMAIHHWGTRGLTHTDHGRQFTS